MYDWWNLRGGLPYFRPIFLFFIFVHFWSFCLSRFHFFRKKQAFWLHSTYWGFLKNMKKNRKNVTVSVHHTIEISPRFHVFGEFVEFDVSIFNRKNQRLKTISFLKQKCWNNYCFRKMTFLGAYTSRKTRIYKRILDFS